MRRTAEAARLQAAVYLKTGRAILPALALLVYLVTFYSIGPADPVTSSTLTALALFLCMAWAGVSFARAEEPVVSQLLQLKLNSAARETVARALLLLASCAAAAVFAAAWPLAKNALSGGAFYSRRIDAADAGAMFLLYFSAAAAGGAFGALFHPRVFRDARPAWLLALLGCLLGTFSGVIARSAPAFAWISPVLPPVYAVLTRFEGMERFHTADLWQTAAALWVYASGAFCVKALLLRRSRY